MIFLKFVLVVLLTGDASKRKLQSKVLGAHLAELQRINLVKCEFNANNAFLFPTVRRPPSNLSNGRDGQLVP